MSADTRGIRELAEQPTDIADRIAHNIAEAAKFSEHETCPSESVMAHVIALEIQAFAESIVEQCAQVADESAANLRSIGDRLADEDRNVLAGKAIMCAQEADKIAAAIRSRWQRGEGRV